MTGAPTLRARGGSLVAALLVGACAGAPAMRAPDSVPAPRTETAPEPAPVASPPAPVVPVEAAYRGRAESLARERRWADAALQWELLALLRPDVAEYGASAADARRRATEAAAERLRLAEAARQRGDLEQASLQYLRALAADPADTRAAEALREIERERVRRAYLNRGPRGVMPGAMTLPAVPRQPPRQPVPDALSDVDTGVLLFKQGDFLGAINALQRHLQSQRGDAMARAYLADAYLQQGGRYAQEGRREDALFYYERAQAAGYRDKGAVQALIRSTRQALGEEYYRLGVQAAPTDPKRALFLWERSLVYDPQHAQAAARVKQLRPASTSGAAPASSTVAPTAAASAPVLAAPAAATVGNAPAR
jgi:tetratricopeptide (TPR) repeat protein